MIRDDDRRWDDLYRLSTPRVGCIADTEDRSRMWWLPRRPVVCYHCRCPACVSIYWATDRQADVIDGRGAVCVASIIASCEHIAVKQEFARAMYYTNHMIACLLKDDVIIHRLNKDLYIFMSRRVSTSSIAMTADINSIQAAFPANGLSVTYFAALETGSLLESHIYIYIYICTFIRR